MFLLFMLAFSAVWMPIEALNDNKGYMSLMHDVQNLHKLNVFINKNPNTLSKITDLLAVSTNLRNLISEQNPFRSLESFPLENVTSDVTTDTESLASTTPPPSLPVSNICINHVKGIIQGLADKQQWALRKVHNVHTINVLSTRKEHICLVAGNQRNFKSRDIPVYLALIDAAGKPPADILGGGLIWLGDYDECLSIQDATVSINTTSYSISGQYCIASLPLQIPPTMFSPVPSVSVGLCLPDSCSDTDASNLINSVISFVSNSSTQAVVSCKHPNKPYDTRAIIVLAVIACFIVIMVAGTIYDVIIVQLPKWQRQAMLSELNGDLVVEASEKAPLIGQNKQIIVEETSDPGIFGKILLAFSIYTNGAKILNTDQSAGSLTAINGIRFLSMSWVILGHSYIFGLSLDDNVLTFLPRMLNRITFMAIANAFVSVDTFFTLSGILLTYLIMKELRKNDGKMNWGMFYFHRFWRLTPPYMLIFMVYIALFPYIGSGPVWPEDGLEPHYCKHGWYYNLFYINNFVDDPDQSCFGWAWYLANDMQFFVISPLIILPMFHFHIAGVIAILAFLLGTWTATGIMTTHWEIPLSVFDGGINFMKLYVKPYFRMGPFLVGMYTGYLLYRTNFKHRMSKVAALFGWVVAAVVACLVLYGQFDDLNGNRVSQEVSSLYNAVHRTLWGACVCWVVFSCANGYGGYINTVLSWKGFIPLSRLTYCTYLVHPIVIYYNQYTKQRLMHLTDIDVIYQFIGNLVVSMMVAFVASLAFESPMMGLEKVIFKKQEKKRR